MIIKFDICIKTEIIYDWLFKSKVNACNCVNLVMELTNF
jgi:hypothetical protein